MTKIDDEKLNQALQQVPSKIKTEIRKILNSNSLEMQRYLREDRLTGGTDERRLAVRSGRLRGSVYVIPAKEEGDSIKSGVSIGTVYAAAHFGPKGQQTVIRPKKGKFLTIPLEAAKTPAGVPKGTARLGPWGATFFAYSKKGNLILFGKRMIMKGKRAGELRGNVLPLFVLKKEVTIKARIDPMDVIKYIAPRIMKDIREQGFRGLVAG